MVASTKVGSVYYEIEGKTEKLDASVARARGLLNELVNAKNTVVDLQANVSDVERAAQVAKRALADAAKAPPPAKITADATPVEAAAQQATRTLADVAKAPPAIKIGADAAPVEAAAATATKTLRSVPGLPSSTPLVSSLRADISLFEFELQRAKTTANKLIGSGASPAIVAKVDATIAGYEAKLKAARAAADDLTHKPLTARLEAQVSGLTAGLKRSASDIESFVSKYADKPIDVPIEATGVDQFVESYKQAGTSIESIAGNIRRALQSPVAAAGLLGAALVTLVTISTKAAAEVDTSLRSLRAALPETNTDLSQLNRELLDLSTISPRSAASLAGTAAAIAKIGTADPAEIGRHLRTLALVGDALGKTDLNPLADQLDLIQDGFNLTGEEARRAYVQIVAMTKGKIDIDDLANVLSRSATRLAAFRVSAQESAAAVATLIDAGVNSRQISTGLVDLLEKASDAERRAIDAAQANREGDAEALRLVARTINATTIESRGLVGALGDLYRVTDGNRAIFTQAGLSLNDYQIAQKAASATTDQARASVLNYDDAVQKLEGSAQVNRESASALAAILKNELGAILIDIGNVFLPPVIAGLRILADLFNRSRAAAKDAAEATQEVADAYARAAAERARAQLAGDSRSGEGAALLNARSKAVGLAKTINTRPEILESSTFDLNQLRETQAQLRKTLFLDQAQGFSKNTQLADALKLVEARLADVTKGAETTTASMDATGKGFSNTGQEAATARDRFEQLTRSISDYAAALGTTNDPVGAAETRIKNYRVELDKLIAKLPEAEKAAAKKEGETLLDQLAEGTERLRTLKTVELTQQIASLLGNASGDAVTALRTQYDGLVRQLEEYAKQADLVGTAESKIAAQRAREAIPGLRAQGEQLEEVARIQEEFAQSLKTIEGFQQQSSANYLGQAVSVAEYRDALANLETEETRLRKLIDDTTTSTKARTEAETKLKAIIEARKKVQGENQPAKTLADSAIELGQLIEGAAAGVASFFQGVNRGNRELVETLGLVSKIGNAIGGLGSLAADAGGFGALLSTGTGILKALPAIGQIAGSVLSIGQKLFGESPEEQAAREVWQANTRAVLQLSANIGDLASSSISGSVINKASAFLADLISTTRGTAFTGGDASRISPSEQRFNRFGLTSAQLSEVARQLGVTLDGTLGSYKKLADAINAADFALLDSSLDGMLRKFGLLSQIAGKSGDAQEELNNKLRALEQLAPKLIAGIDISDAQTEEGRLRLREQLGAILEKGLTLDPNSEEARAFFALLGDLSPQDFLTLFSDILTGLDGFEAAAAETSNKLKEFADRARIFGITGAEYVQGLVDVYAEQFDQLNGLLEGIDLEAEGGLDALRERIQGIFTALAEDGITGAEQSIIDALLAILSAAESVSVDIEEVAKTLSERVRDALGQLDLDNAILGGDAKDRFNRLKGVASGLSDDLASIIGDLDFDSLGSAETARQRLRDLYVSLLADGISEDEEAIVALIRDLLGGIDDVLDEEEDSASRLADRIAQGIRDRQQRASDDIAVGDLTGSDAFRKTLEGYGDAFSGIFGVFDVSTVEGVDKAKGALRDLLEGVRNGTVNLEDFAGMTEEEVIAAIRGLDGALDGLAGSARAAADAAAQFVDSVNIDYLRATGQDQEADIAVLKASIAAKIQQAKELKLGDDIIEIIQRTGDLQLEALIRKYQEAASPAEVRDAEAKDRRSEFIASAVTQITGQQALQITDYLASSLIEQRANRIATEALVALAGGERIAALTPSLPPGVGGPTGLTNSNGVVFIVNFNGPLSGITPQDAAEEFIETIGPAFDAYLARSAGISAKNQGRTLT